MASIFLSGIHLICLRLKTNVYLVDRLTNKIMNTGNKQAFFWRSRFQGLVANHVDVVDYFNQRGVSAIFLFRRNLLRQLVSQLANNHDRSLKQLNGTHKAHVHTKHEVMLYKKWFNSASVMSAVSEWSLCLMCYFSFTGSYTCKIQAQAQHDITNMATETSWWIHSWCSSKPK